MLISQRVEGAYLLNHGLVLGLLPLQGQGHPDGLEVCTLPDKYESHLHDDDVVERAICAPLPDEPDDFG